VQFHKHSYLFEEKNNKNTVLFCDHKFESELIATILTQSTIVKFLGLKCLKGRTDTKTVTIVIAGPNPDFFNSTFKKYVRDLHGTEIIFFGTSGSLNPRISLGDVVTAHIPFSWRIEKENTLENYIIPGIISENISEEGEEKSYYSHNFKHWSGSVATCDHNLKLRENLRDITGEPLIDCIDTSSGYAARICSRAGLPFLVVKGISHAIGSKELIDSIHHNMKAVIHGSYLIMDYLSSEYTISDWLGNMVGV